MGKWQAQRFDEQAPPETRVDQMIFGKEADKLWNAVPRRAGTTLKKRIFDLWEENFKFEDGMETDDEDEDGENT